jgi:hypothetical protein
LERDPYSIPGLKKEGEEGGAEQSQLTNAGGKRVSALMLYLEQKWTGKLDGPMDSRRASRQVTAFRVQGVGNLWASLPANWVIIDAFNGRLAASPG